MTTLEKGTRIYNHGDQANNSHFGTVTEVRTDRWGTKYEIMPDALEPGLRMSPCDQVQPCTIPAVIVSPEFLGHGGTRIVTEAAYREYRQKRLAEMAAKRTA